MADLRAAAIEAAHESLAAAGHLLDTGVVALALDAADRASLAGNPMAASLDDLEERYALDAQALNIALALAEADPVSGRMCELCEATTRGGASTITPADHRPSCPWVQARALAARLRKEASGPWDEIDDDGTPAEEADRG